MGATERNWAELAGQVKKRREYLGLGQADLGVSDLTLRKVEQGQGDSVRGRTLRQIENGLRWRSGTVDRVLDGTATTEDLLGGFGVLWLQNISGGPLVIERPIPDADTVTVDSMGIVQVVGAVSAALREVYRTEHHDHPRSWSTWQWKLIKNEPPQAEDDPELGVMGGDAVARMSVELLGQLLLHPRRTPAEERLVHSLIAVVAERSGASVAYTTGTASITTTTTDPDTDNPVTQTLLAGHDI
jgi:hypothetical protein